MGNSTTPADHTRACGFCGRMAVLKYDEARGYLRCICECGAHLTSSVHTPSDVAGEVRNRNG